MGHEDEEEPKLINRLLRLRDSLEEKLAAAERRAGDLQYQLDEIQAAIASEGPHTIEHLIATASIGKHTAVIGRSRLKQLHDAERRIAKLEEALLDAIESLESWAGYASDYFREKHDLAGDVARLTAALRDEGADDGK